MSPIEKISHRVALLQSLCTPKHRRPTFVDGNAFFVNYWAGDRVKGGFVRIHEDDLFSALEKVTRIADREWLAGKVEHIQDKGMHQFMDYLDRDNLDRLLDPTIDLFPAAGI